MLDMNKINLALDNTKERLKTLDAEQLKQLDKTLEVLSIQELAWYQEVKSLAQIDNKISLDVAMYIYNTLNSWNSANLADRVIITQLMSRMLSK